MKNKFVHRYIEEIKTCRSNFVSARQNYRIKKIYSKIKIKIK